MKHSIKLNTKSFGFKLFSIVMLLVVVPLGILGATSYYKATDTLQKRVEGDIKDYTKQANVTVNATCDIAESQLKTLAADPIWTNWSGSAEDIAYLNNLCKNITTSSSNFTNTYFGGADGNFIIYPNTKMPDGYDARTRGWYTDAVAKPFPRVWSKTYIDAASKKPMVTVSESITRHGKLLGVIGFNWLCVCVRQ